MRRRACLCALQIATTKLLPIHCMLALAPSRKQACQVGTAVAQQPGRRPRQVLLPLGAIGGTNRRRTTPPRGLVTRDFEVPLAWKVSSPTRVLAWFLHAAMWPNQPARVGSLRESRLMCLSRSVISPVMPSCQLVEQVLMTIVVFVMLPEMAPLSCRRSAVQKRIKVMVSS